MDALDYAGIVLAPQEVPTAVAMAASGRIPAPRRGPPPTDDPAVWLCGLVERASGTPMEGTVHRALEMALRTGNSRQLQSLAPVAVRFPIFDGHLLISTLERRQNALDREAIARYAEAIGRWVARGVIPYEDRLRLHLEDRRLRGGLIPAYLVADRAWFLDALEPLLARHPGEGAAQVASALAGLEAAEAAAVCAAIAARLAGLSEPVREALGVAIPALRPPAPPVQVELPRLDPDALPWRGEDGRWFLVSDDAHVPAGEYELRRGLRMRRVQRRAVAAYEIPAEDAERLRAGQLAALWAAGREMWGRVTGRAVEAVGVEEAGALVRGEAAAREEAAARVAALRRRLAGVWGEEE